MSTETTKRWLLSTINHGRDDISTSHCHKRSLLRRCNVVTSKIYTYFFSCDKFLLSSLMRIMLRFIPRRSLLVAMVLTALLGGVYYAWNPPTKRPQSHKTVKIDEDELSLLKAQLNPKVPSAEPFKTFENVSSSNFLDEPIADDVEPDQQQPLCHPLPLKEAAMETADIYPKLNFNVSHCWLSQPKVVVKLC